MLYIIIVWLHLLAAVIWIGGMLFITLILAPYLRTISSIDKRVEITRGVGKGFRIVGWICIGILLITGIYNISHHYHHYVESLFVSREGIILGIKLTIVMVMIALSVLHDFILGPRLTAIKEIGPEYMNMQRRVTLSARLNLILGLLVLALAVALVRS